jgi:hypothetical protein
VNPQRNDALSEGARKKYGSKTENRFDRRGGGFSFGPLLNLAAVATGFLRPYVHYSEVHLSTRFDP